MNMAEAVLDKDANANALDLASAPAALSAGQVLQLADGRAAVVAGLAGAASGDPATLQTAGQFVVAKTSGVVILDGGEVMWDHSANSATIPLYGTSKDFYLGRAVGDAASADTTMTVELNAPKDSAYITLQNDAFATVHVRTAGLTNQGMSGGSYSCQFSTDAEAQKFDLLSVKAFALDSNWILEAVVNVVTTCDADAGDLSVGVANGTHASDADAITESAFFHFDLGADVNIDAESDDGTTEVAATDTTVDFSAGTAVHLVLDGRSASNVKYYVNGVEVLASTANLGNIALATGPLKALFHLEKSANDTPGNVRLSKLEVRLTADVEA
jgi:predicted RecA/RadA family phage recombinase